MNLRRMKWMLFIVPAVVIGVFETIRHTLLEQVIPLELGNWITACIDAAVIAIITRQLLQRFAATESELNEERAQRIVLQERERLARVLHDQIAQTIFYSGVQVNAAREAAADLPQVAERLEEVRMSLREIDENIRQAIFNLREDGAPDDNLQARFRSYLRRTFNGTAIAWQLNYADDSPDFGLAEQVHMFGILQEAITNIIKHAAASAVLVQVSGRSDDVAWTLVVTDNGRGFTAGTTGANKFGLELMKSRADEIGAEMIVDSGRQGTTITVKGY